VTLEALDMSTTIVERRAHQEATIETRASWRVAATAVAIASVSFGAPYIAVVALQPIAADLGSARSVPALAFALAYLGTALGGVVMGLAAQRVGIRPVVIGGAVMIALGLALSSFGGETTLWLAHGVCLGLLGNACINAPLYVHVSRWFDRRRGSAVALFSSGQYLAGAIWTPIFARAAAALGWRHTMLLFAVFEVAAIVPAALVGLGTAPEPRTSAAAAVPAAGSRVLGWPPQVIQGLLCCAGFLCCVPMAMPQAHLVAFCGDIGISAAHGAAMLSVLLGCAFLSRQFWGMVADRFGGLRAVLAGSACQLTAMTGFLLTQDEAGLFAVAAAFGLGFAGIVPAYVVAIRELFPAAEASWRVPIQLSCVGCGMATGGWLAGAIYDHFGFYGAAFGTGILFNAANLAVVGTLVLCRNRHWRGG
jgi:MFS family permease